MKLAAGYTLHPSYENDSYYFLEDADYLTSAKAGNGPASRTSVALTHQRRAALDHYTDTLRGMLNGL